MSQEKTTLKYRRISQELIDRISRGDYPPGTQLPTEVTLSREFQVNRHTVREAIRELKEDGLVYSVRGKGVFVATTHVVYRLSDKVRFTQNIRESNLSPEAQLVDWKVVPADADTASRMQLKAGEPLLKLDILRRVNKLPFSVASSYLPESRFGSLPDLIRGSFSLYQLLQAHFDVLPQRSESLIETRLPDDQEQKLLLCSFRQPVLVVRSLACDQHGKNIEYVVSRTRGDLGCLSIDFDEISMKGHGE